MSLETTIIRGSDEEFERAMDSTECLVVDHRDEESEVLSGLATLLPGFSYTYRYDSEGTCHVESSFLNRNSTHRYTNTPYNCFRIVRDVQALITPESEIRVYTPTIGDDTHVFVIGDRAFWERINQGAGARRKAMFADLGFLESGWQLSGNTVRPRKWWQFWK